MGTLTLPDKIEVDAVFQMIFHQPGIIIMTTDVVSLLRHSLYEHLKVFCAVMHKSSKLPWIAFLGPVNQTSAGLDLGPSGGQVGT